MENLMSKSAHLDLDIRKPTNLQWTSVAGNDPSLERNFIPCGYAQGSHPRKAGAGTYTTTDNMIE